MLTLKSGVIETGVLEYYLVGLERYEDFDIVLNLLLHLDARIKDRLDGIYSRTATLEKEGHTFIVIFHEDVGVYAFITGKQSPQLNEWLEHILEKVVQGITLQ